MGQVQVRHILRATGLTVVLKLLTPVRQFPIGILGKDMIWSARNIAQERNSGRTGLGGENGRTVYPIGPQLQRGNDDRAYQ
jgi:hypothetical protein